MLNPSPRESCAIVVLGTYGSGSSAVAGILYHLGVMMGAKLVPPTESNPKGHYEDMHFREMLYQYREDKSVLLKMISFIEARFMNFDLWGVKEPAIIEAIMDLAPHFASKKYKVITTEREPMACARSYKRKWPDSDVDSTYTHIVNILAERQRFIDAFNPEIYRIDFNALTKNPEEGVQKIIKFVFGDKPNIFEDKPWPTDEQIQKAIASIDPDLNHRLDKQQPST